MEQLAEATVGEDVRARGGTDGLHAAREQRGKPQRAIVHSQAWVEMVVHHPAGHLIEGFLMEGLVEPFEAELSREVFDLKATMGIPGELLCEYLG